jgi:hypothetical protein
MLPLEPCLCPLHLINLLPLEPCLYPLHLINLLPLEPCLCPLHLINLSPFVINGKGIFPSGVAPPDRLSSYGASSCTSKTYKISIQKAFIFGVEITPSLWRRYSKASHGSGFVKMSCHLFFCAHILNSDVLFCNLFP